MSAGGTAVLSVWDRVLAMFVNIDVLVRDHGSQFYNLSCLNFISFHAVFAAVLQVSDGSAHWVH